jgi:hypothetical protein
MSFSFISRDYDLICMCMFFQSDTPAAGSALTANMHVSTQETSVQTDNRRGGGIQVYIYR